MKKTITLFIVLVMALAMVACSSNKDSDDNQADNTPSVTKPADKPSDDKASNDKADGENNSNDSSEFLSWTDVDMVNYMKAQGVFTEEDWLYTQTEGDEAPVGITKLISYIDDYGDADIMIVWLETDGPTARTEEIYNEIKTTHNYIMTEAGNVPCPFNALYGRFAILYSFSLDDELVEKCEAALENLTTEYGIEPDFYEKELEMPDYDDYYDDDYFDYE